MGFWGRFFAILLAFLSNVNLTGRAQNDFFKFDNSLRHLFPYDGKALPNLKELDDGSIQRVVSILQSNIKQWSFVESQLLEPNVNLGMPEIFIPLGHLTTTLEVLGNILFMREEINEAKQSLERACPLMELLPTNFNEGHQYTSGCFAVLREVYQQLYGVDSSGKYKLAAPSTSKKKKSSINSRKKKKGRNSRKKLYDERLDDDEGSTVKIRRRGSDPYGDDTYSPVDTDEDGPDGDDVIINNRYKHRKSHSRKGSTAAKQLPPLPSGLEELYYDSDEDTSVVGGGDTDDVNTFGRHGVGGESDDDDGDGEGNFIPFDVEKRLDELRAPFDHLRAELQQQQNQQGVQSPGRLPAALLGIPSGLSPQGGSAGGTDPGGTVHIGIQGGLGSGSVGGAELLGVIDAASGIAGDLETLLHRFVFEDEEGRRSILDLAKQYHEELNANLESSSQSMQQEFADDLELSKAYLAIMSRAQQEGLLFLRSELLGDVGGKLLEGATLASLEDLMPHLGLGLGVQVELLPKDPKHRMLVLGAFGRALNGELGSGQIGAFGRLSPGLNSNGGTGPPHIMMSPLHWLAMQQKQQQEQQPAKPQPLGQGHDKEASAAMFHTSTLANLDDISPSLRASIPTVKGDSVALGGIGLFLFILAWLVLAAYQESQRKRVRGLRNRAQKKSWAETVLMWLQGQSTADEERDADAVSPRDKEKGEGKSDGKPGSITSGKLRGSYDDLRATSSNGGSGGAVAGGGSSNGKKGKGDSGKSDAGQGGIFPGQMWLAALDNVTAHLAAVSTTLNSRLQSMFYSPPPVVPPQPTPSSSSPPSTTTTTSASNSHSYASQSKSQHEEHSTHSTTVSSHAAAGSNHAVSAATVGTGSSGSKKDKPSKTASSAGSKQSGHVIEKDQPTGELSSSKSSNITSKSGPTETSKSKDSKETKDKSSNNKQSKTSPTTQHQSDAKDKVTEEKKPATVADKSPEKSKDSQSSSAPSESPTKKTQKKIRFADNEAGTPSTNAVTISSSSTNASLGLDENMASLLATGSVSMSVGGFHVLDEKDIDDESSFVAVPVKAKRSEAAANARAAALSAAAKQSFEQQQKLDAMKAQKAASKLQKQTQQRPSPAVSQSPTHSSKAGLSTTSSSPNTTATAANKWKATTSPPSTTHALQAPGSQFLPPLQQSPSHAHAPQAQPSLPSSHSPSPATALPHGFPHPPGLGLPSHSGMDKGSGPPGYMMDVTPHARPAQQPSMTLADIVQASRLAQEGVADSGRPPVGPGASTNKPYTPYAQVVASGPGAPRPQQQLKVRQSSEGMPALQLASSMSPPSNAHKLSPNSTLLSHSTSPSTAAMLSATALNPSTFMLPVQDSLAFNSTSPLYFSPQQQHSSASDSSLRFSIPRSDSLDSASSSGSSVFSSFASSHFTKPPSGSMSVAGTVTSILGSTSTDVFDSVASVGSVGGGEFWRLGGGGGSATVSTAPGLMTPSTAAFGLTLALGSSAGLGGPFSSLGVSVGRPFGGADNGDLDLNSIGFGVGYGSYESESSSMSLHASVTSTPSRRLRGPSFDNSGSVFGGGSSLDGTSGTMNPSSNSSLSFDADDLSLAAALAYPTLSAKAPSFSPGTNYSTAPAAGGYSSTSSPASASSQASLAGAPGLPAPTDKADLKARAVASSSTSADSPSSLSLTAHCTFLTAAKTKAVRVASNLFNNWSTAHAAPMRRSMANPQLWGCSVQVPGGTAVFQYKYLALDTDGQVWVEKGPVRRARIGDPAAEHEDHFSEAAPLNS